VRGLRIFLRKNVSPVALKAKISTGLGLRVGEGIRMGVGGFVNLDSEGVAVGELVGVIDNVVEGEGVTIGSSPIDPSPKIVSFHSIRESDKELMSFTPPPQTQQASSAVRPMYLKEKILE
jgi:hypothetical protein